MITLPKKKIQLSKKEFFQNQVAFKEKLNELNIFRIIKSEDVDEAFNLFMTEFNRIFNECFPFVTMKVNSCKSDWYDKELKQLHEQKNLLYKKYLDKKL